MNSSSASVTEPVIGTSEYLLPAGTLTARRVPPSARAPARGPTPARRTIRPRSRASRSGPGAAVKAAERLARTTPRRPPSSRGRRRAAAAVLSLVESQRRQLARQLHDETAQILTATLFRARLVRSRSSGRSTNRAASKLRAIRETLAPRPATFIRLVYSLSPAGFGRAGSWPRCLAGGNFQTAYQIAVTLEAPELGRLRSCSNGGVPNRPGGAHQRRPAAAGPRGRGRGALTPRAVSCTIRDDDEDFDRKPFSSREGPPGLMGMRERASHFGGALTLSSGPGLEQPSSHHSVGGKGTWRKSACCSVDDHKILRNGSRRCWRPSGHRDYCEAENGARRFSWFASSDPTSS